MGLSASFFWLLLVDVGLCETKQSRAMGHFWKELFSLCGPHFLLIRWTNTKLNSPDPSSCDPSPPVPHNCQQLFIIAASELRFHDP